MDYCFFFFAKSMTHEVKTVKIKNGGNDWAELNFDPGKSGNDGVFYIDTWDDGSEKIVVRAFDTKKRVKNTFTLMDNAGNHYMNNIGIGRNNTFNTVLSSPKAGQLDMQLLDSSHKKSGTISATYDPGHTSVQFRNSQGEYWIKTSHAKQKTPMWISYGGWERPFLISADTGKDGPTGTPGIFSVDWKGNVQTAGTINGIDIAKKFSDLESRISKIDGKNTTGDSNYNALEKKINDTNSNLSSLNKTVSDISGKVKTTTEENTKQDNQIKNLDNLISSIPTDSPQEVNVDAINDTIKQTNNKFLIASVAISAVLVIIAIVFVLIFFGIIPLPKDGGFKRVQLNGGLFGGNNVNQEI